MKKNYVQMQNGLSARWYLKLHIHCNIPYQEQSIGACLQPCLYIRLPTPPKGNRIAFSLTAAWGTHVRTTQASRKNTTRHWECTDIYICIYIYDIAHSIRSDARWAPSRGVSAYHSRCVPKLLSIIYRSYCFDHQ